MRRKKRSLVNLFIAIVGLGTLFYLILSFSPDFVFQLFHFKIQAIYPFFLLVFITSYYLFFYIFISKRQSFLATLFILAYLFLRINDLTHPFFLLLLAAICVTIELFFRRKKR